MTAPRCRLVWFQSPRTQQLLRFGVTGLIGAVVDFTTYNVLSRALECSSYYELFGQRVLVANNISVLFAIVSNFVLNKYWTFRDCERCVGRQWTSYVVMNGMTWILNQLLVSLLIFNVPLMAYFHSQRDNAAKLIAIGLIFFLNFAGSKSVVFREHAMILDR